MGKLDEVLNRTRKGVGSFFVEKNEHKVCRMMPSYQPADAARAKSLGAFLQWETGILVFHQHRSMYRIQRAIVPGSQWNNKETNYRCPRDVNQRCRICDFLDPISKDSPDFELKKEHGSQGKALCHVYSKDEGVVIPWWLSKTCLTILNGIFSQYPELNHPKKGRNIQVTRYPSNPWYAITASPNVTSLPVAETNWPDITDELGKMIIPNPAEQVEILKQQFGIEG